MTGGGRPSQRQKVIASLFLLSLRWAEALNAVKGQRGNPGKAKLKNQKAKWQSKNEKQSAVTWWLKADSYEIWICSEFSALSLGFTRGLAGFTFYNRVFTNLTPFIPLSFKGEGEEIYRKGFHPSLTYTGETTPFP